MRIKDYDEYLEGEDSIPWQRNVHKIGTRRRRSKQFAEDLIDPHDLPTGAFKPTYTGSRHELHWILTYLSPFHEEGQILDVLRLVKGGKEANVYCCRAHPSLGVNLLAAKLYRPRMFRNLRNDAQYRQGRAVLDERGRAVHDPRRLHAIQRGTNLGKELVHTSWLTHEYETLRLLYEAGPDVPRPITVSENVILMEYLGDDLRGAPTLNHARSSRRRLAPSSTACCATSISCWHEAASTGICYRFACASVSRHLRVLREAGLVEVRQEAQRRVYGLRPEPLAEVDEWLGRYRALWEQRLDALYTEVAPGLAPDVSSVQVCRADRRTTRHTGGPPLQSLLARLDPSHRRRGAYMVSATLPRRQPPTVVQSSRQAGCCV